jgi:hypothetical protein
MGTFQKTNTFIRNPDVVSRLVGEEMILVPIRATIVDLRCLFTMNDTGTFIWRQLGEPRTVDQLSDEVTKEFDVPIAQAREDTERFIQQLVDEGCVLEAE